MPTIPTSCIARWGAPIWLCAILIGGLVTGTPAPAEDLQTAWQALVRENPDLDDDVTLGPLERAVLETLTPEQHAAFVDGADPTSLVLASGETLADFLERFATKGAVAEGLVYYPSPAARCFRPGARPWARWPPTRRVTSSFVARRQISPIRAARPPAVGCRRLRRH